MLVSAVTVTRSPHHSQFQNIFITSETDLSPVTVTPAPNPSKHHVLAMIALFWTFNNGTTQHVILCVWLFSLACLQGSSM